MNLSRHVLLALTVLVWVASAQIVCADGEHAAQQETAKLSDKQRERARRMIGRLDGESVTAVRSAFESLRGMGEPVLGELQQALSTAKNPKVKDRLQQIIEAIKVDSIHKHAVHLDMILEEVRQANRDNLKEEKLEALLERLIVALQVATEDDTLELPVRFGDVTRGQLQRGHSRNQLLIAPKVEMSSVQNSIVLADSVVHISSAQNSIIIARVATNITSARNCIVLTGVVSEMSSLDNCVILSGVSARVSRANRSILGATEPVQLSIGRDGTALINAKPDERMAQRGVRGVVAGGVVLRGEKKKNPLEGKLTVTHAYSGDGGLALFRLKDGSGEYVARTDKEIRRADGTPVAELAGWKLHYAGRGFVVFGDGERYSYLPVER